MNFASKFPIFEAQHVLGAMLGDHRPDDFYFSDGLGMGRAIASLVRIGPWF